MTDVYENVLTNVGKLEKPRDWHSSSPGRFTQILNGALAITGKMAITSSVVPNPLPGKALPILNQLSILASPLLITIMLIKLTTCLKA